MGGSKCLLQMSLSKPRSSYQCWVRWPWVGAWESRRRFQGLVAPGNSPEALSWNQSWAPVSRMSSCGERGLGILWHEQVLCDQQGHLWEAHHILETSRMSLLSGSSLSVLRSWALQGSNSRSPIAGRLREERDSASETGFCSRATGRSALRRY